MIVDCNVLCFKEGNENLKIDDVDTWLPISIDLDKVIAIKKNGREEEFSNKAVIYHSADYFIVDLDFDEAIILWKKSKAE